MRRLLFLLVLFGFACNTHPASTSSRETRRMHTLKETEGLIIPENPLAPGNARRWALQESCAHRAATSKENVGQYFSQLNVPEKYLEYTACRSLLDLPFVRVEYNPIRVLQDSAVLRRRFEEAVVAMIRSPYPEVYGVDFSFKFRFFGDAKDLYDSRAGTMLDVWVYLASEGMFAEDIGTTDDEIIMAYQYGMDELYQQYLADRWHMTSGSVDDRGAAIKTLLCRRVLLEYELVQFGYSELDRVLALRGIRYPQHGLSKEKVGELSCEPIP